MTRRKQESWWPKSIGLGLLLAVTLTGADFDWNLPKGFPRPVVPADNPMSAAKVELGRYLFYDKRMSANGKEYCASCHRQHGDGKYGKALYDADCGICHEGEHRATMVPDLHALKGPTSEAFWHEWIAHGKPRSLMPAFSRNDGGPLTDEQITSLADYLRSTMPAREF